ncbi:MAG: hypothetical protein NC225_10770 [Clostridium sp.]|nr:hypothetical protein [Clostridium sp.]MCM1399947.1 hypothetical protein [Clostridium sp.]MCM1460312.1 hypothetical protein [Bacteroides sp.]
MFKKGGRVHLNGYIWDIPLEYDDKDGTRASRDIIDTACKALKGEKDL